MMKKTHISVSLLASLCFLTTPSLVFAKTNEEELAQKLQEISRQASELQREMKTLKAELAELKKSKKKVETKLVKANQAKIDEPGESAEGAVAESSIDPSLAFFSRFPTVTTSPYIGLRSAFDASDLVINVPTMGEDLRLLRERQKLGREIGVKLPYEDRPIIVVSGKLEAYAQARKTYTGESESDIDLNTMELDLLIHAGPWAFGFVSIDYDNTFLDTSLVNSPVGNRISNSRIFLKRGFITLGNLEKFPVYMSVGQMYLNFGRYGSALVTPALTQVLGQTNERQFQIGYAKEDGFSFSSYLFRGATHVGENSNRVNEGGVNGRYIKELKGDRSISFGAGFISNIANSDAIQVTNLPYPRQGFASLSDIIFLPNERIVHRAPAVNAHVEYSTGPWTIMGEYVGTVRPFSIENFNYNGRGASPKAVHAELNRKFLVLDKPANASIAYGQSWQALAIGLPSNKYSFVFNISPVKNTIFSLEFSHFKNYAKGTVADIKGTNIPLILPIAPYVSPGGSSNMILAQLGLYF